MVEPQENLVELEIAAFMTPHIKRARIALVVVGLLYLIVGYLDYDVIAQAREQIRRLGDIHTPELDAARDTIQLAYVLVVGMMIAGAVNIVLAAIAGKVTMLAFYVAAGIFVVMTTIHLYASQGTILTNPLWWLAAASIGLGFQAARKAEWLRASKSRV